MGWYAEAEVYDCVWLATRRSTKKTRGDPRRTQRGTKEGEAGGCRLGSRFGVNRGGRYGRSGCYELEGGEIQGG